MVVIPIAGATASAGIAIIAFVNAAPAVDGVAAAVVLAAASTLGEYGFVLDLRGGLGHSSVQGLVGHNIIKTTSGHLGSLPWWTTKELIRRTAPANA